MCENYYVTIDITGVVCTQIENDKQTQWSFCLSSLSRRHTRRFYSPIAANKIASDFRHRLMRTHLAIFFADCGDVAVLKLV